MQFAEILKLGKIPLAQNFIDCHTYCVGKVEASGGTTHRQADALFGMLQQELLGKPFGLLPENKKAVFGVFHIAVGMARLGCEEKEASAFILLQKVFHIIIIGQIKEMPIIKTRSFELFIVYLKAHGADNMKPCTRCGACAGDIACVLRDLGLYKNYV